LDSQEQHEEIKEELKGEDASSDFMLPLPRGSGEGGVGLTDRA